MASYRLADDVMLADGVEVEVGQGPDLLRFGKVAMTEVPDGREDIEGLVERGTLTALEPGTLRTQKMDPALLGPDPDAEGVS